MRGRAGIKQGTSIQLGLWHILATVPTSYRTGIQHCTSEQLGLWHILVTHLPVTEQGSNNVLVYSWVCGTY